MVHDNFEETELFTTLDHVKLISRKAIYLNKTTRIDFLSQFPQTSIKCFVIATKIFCNQALS